MKNKSIRKKALKLVFATSILIGISNNLEAGNLKFCVTDVQPKRNGFVLAALYKKKGYLNLESVITTIRIKANTQTLTGTFHDLPSGRYSVAVFHDTDNNKRMSYILGFPKEGYGFSRIEKKMFRKPHFDETSVSLNSNETISTKILMQYL